MSDRGKRIKPQPLAVTLYQKASRAIDVLLAGRFIDSPECKPRHMRKVVMNCMIVIVQEQQAPVPRGFIEHRAMLDGICHPMLVKRPDRAQ